MDFLNWLYNRAEDIALFSFVTLPVWLPVLYLVIRRRIKADVTPEEERLLRTRLSNDEELLACIPVTGIMKGRVVGKLARRIAGLTHRRIVLLLLWGKSTIREETVIENSHITDTEFTPDAIHLTMRSGDRYSLTCDDRKEDFCRQLGELLDRQSKRPRLTGAADE